MSASASLVGRTLGDRFDILGLLGAGGMGAVYRARDRELDELVAFKVIRDELAGDPEALARFRREVKLARRVTHPNVARVFELGRADGVTFCTMELIDGEPLSRRAARGRLALADAVAIVAAACDALGAAHAAGVIHRDVKPENILVGDDGRVVVADFGIAAAAVAGEAEASGTVAYMAPEQAHGLPPSPAVDLYALGVVLYELLEGRRAFPGGALEVLAAKAELEHLAPLEAHAPAELAALVARATARDPRRRPASAAAFRAGLAPWLRGAARPVPAAPLAPRPAEAERPSLFILPPRAVDPDAGLEPAWALHEALLVHLGRRGGLRVRPRGAAPRIGPRDRILELAQGDVLRATLVDDAGAVRFAVEVPRDSPRANAAAAAVARALELAFEVDDPRGAPPSPVEELLARARFVAYHGPRDLARAAALFAEAAAEAPGDPRVAAGLAMAQVRQAFFSPKVSAELMEAAGALARDALAAAPGLAEAHLAVGHVELHTGDPVVAARRFRAALSLDPHSPDVHLWLGRMLLEAGFLAPGLARFEEAIAIAPRLEVVRWEIIRAHALEGQWDEVDRLSAALRERTSPALGSERHAMQARFAMWRGRPDELRDALVRLVDEEAQLQTPSMAGHIAHAYANGGWAAHREALLRFTRAPTPDRRRRAVLAQIAADAAGVAGDHPACLELLGDAVAAGLFDLHWLDRSPPLAGVRGTPAFAALRAVTKARADGILDAFYGEEPVDGTAETSLATGDGPAT